MSESSPFDPTRIETTPGPSALDEALVTQALEFGMRRHASGVDNDKSGSKPENKYQTNSNAQVSMA